MKGLVKDKNKGQKDAKLDDLCHWGEGIKILDIINLGVALSHQLGFKSINSVIWWISDWEKSLTL